VPPMKLRQLFQVKVTALLNSMDYIDYINCYNGFQLWFRVNHAAQAKAAEYFARSEAELSPSAKIKKLQSPRRPRVSAGSSSSRTPQGRVESLLIRPIQRSMFYGFHARNFVQGLERGGKGMQMLQNSLHGEDFSVLEESEVLTTMADLAEEVAHRHDQTAKKYQKILRLNTKLPPGRPLAPGSGDCAEELTVFLGEESLFVGKAAPPGILKGRRASYAYSLEGEIPLATLSVKQEDLCPASAALP